MIISFEPLHWPVVSFKEHIFELINHQSSLFRLTGVVTSKDHIPIIRTTGKSLTEKPIDEFTVIDSHLSCNF